MSRMKTLKSLLSQMDTIEGTTEGGRHFKISFIQSTENFKTQIFSSMGYAYEPSLRMLEVLDNNILSVINKIDENFFDKRGNHSKTNRKIILVKGKQEETPFTIRVRVENNWVSGNLDFRGQNNTLEMNKLIPDHIPYDQKHNWLYLHFQKPEVWLDVLQFNIKDKYYTCCGNNIRGKFNYCYSCGKKQVVNGLEITEVVGTELLTLLS